MPSLPANASQFQAAVTAAIQEASPDGILLVDPHGTVISHNQRFIDIWKVAPESVRGASDVQMLQEVTPLVADPQAFIACTKDLYLHREATSRDEVRFKDGRTLDRYSAPVRLDDGTYLGRVWFFRDVTEDRRASVKIQEDASQFNALIDQQVAGIFIIAGDGTLAFVNPRFSALFGYSSAEIVGRPFLDLIVDSDRAFIHQLFLEHLKGDPPATRIDTALKRKGGGTMNIMAHASRSSFDGKPALIGILVDMTEERRATDLARAGEQRFRLLVDAAPDAIVVFDVDADRFIDANKSAATLFGCGREELLKVGLRHFLLPDEATATSVAQDFAEHTRQVLSGQPSAFERRIRNAQGRELICTVALMRLPTVTGRLIRGSLMDITERRQSEQALRLSDERFRNTFEAVNDSIAVFDIATGLFIDVNPRACEMFGYSRAEILKQGFGPFLAGIPPYTTADMAPLLQRAVDGTPMLFEWLCKAKDGHTFWVEASLRRAQFGGRAALFVTTQDITRYKVALEALAYRDGVSHAVTLSVAKLVSGGSLTATLSTTLDMVALALRVDRILVLKRTADAGPSTAVKLVYAWQVQDQPAMDPALLARMFEDSLEYAAWQALLMAGKPVIVHADTATGVIAQVMRDMSNLSTLMLPIFVNGRYWGLIGIDACKAARQWTTVEIDTLVTLAEVIGTVVTREETQVTLKTSEERFRAVSDTAQDAIIMVDSRATVVYWNHSAERILGYTAAEAVGRSPHDWLAPQRFHDQAIAGMTTFAASGRGNFVGANTELAALRKDGVEIPVEISISSMRLGDQWHAVAMMRDITERKRVEQRLSHMARYDSLTGLANRASFVDALREAIAAVHKGGKGFALLYLGLDHFKDVNNTLGHPIGDLLLQSLADRLRRNVRSTDIVARFGGDEFALIEPGAADAATAVALADTLLRAIDEPFLIQGTEVRSAASIGIALYGPDSADAETLLSHADVALYRAKQDGRGTYRFFTNAMDLEVQTRVTLAAEVRAGLAAGQFFLMFQPQIDADTGRIAGVEALARWHHPNGNIVQPNVFIPVAEKSGLIIALGKWALLTACRQMKLWLDEGIAPPLIAVNVSGAQFKNPHEIDTDLAAILAETAVPPQRVELELTESVLMKVSREHNDALLRLRKCGHRIAIDDFGSGYSSLEYLGRFPVDQVKIGQTFILDLATAPSNSTVAKAAVGLAHDLHLDVVVEGVETAEQLKQVRAWGCRKVQGFYFSKPLSAADLTCLLRTGAQFPVRDASTATSSASAA